MTYGELADELARLNGQIYTFDPHGAQLSANNSHVQRLLCLIKKIEIELGVVTVTDIEEEEIEGTCES